MKTAHAIALSVDGDLIRAFFDDTVKSSGAFTPVDIGKAMGKFGLPFKTICEFLEDGTRLHTGTYDRLVQRGLRVGPILREAVRNND